MERVMEILPGIDTDTRDWKSSTYKNSNQSLMTIYFMNALPLSLSVTAVLKYCSNNTVASKEHKHIFMHMHGAEKVLHDQRQLDNVNAK